ncbi:MAG: hypothetical protein R3B89_15505 [Polyangiaceae bacterium]
MSSGLGFQQRGVWRWTVGALALGVMVACGGSDGGGGGGNSGGSGNGGTGNTNGGSGNGGSGNGGTGNAPGCTQVCDALAQCGVDSSQCSSVCGDLPDACRACLVNEGCDSPSCEAPCSGGANGGSGGDGGSGGSDNGGSGGTGSDAWGQKCSVILEDCPGAYDCLNKSGSTLDDGICTQACTSFADCPTFWDCTQVGSGKYCFP